ncbi:unnamed protein product [Dibothriocephalus latus]|uniref:non-specific protein-tyrosine kinase n=1 Tax=Dibothriocephalus latus TaxID=60516 RepID=A0A3P7MPF8_DIBLA|nr:unnamed protein product [Dibothriocephalus latus]
MVTALYDFNAPEPADLSFKAGDILLLEDNQGQGWTLAFNPRTLRTGNIPMNYMATESDSVACKAWYNINRTEAERKLFIPGVENGMFILRPSSGTHYKVNFPPTEGKFYIRPNFRADTLDELLIFYMTTPLDISGCLLMPRPKVVPPPFNFQEFAIDRSIIKLTDRLGCGNFGEVWLAKMQTVTVAVKTCLPTATKEDFVNEAQTMFILNHPRLVRFLGYCNRPADEPFYLITEYMENGSLKDFLIENQKRIEYEKCIQIIHQVCLPPS